MFSEKVNLLKIEIASHFGQIWPALSMWVKCKFDIKSAFSHVPMDEKLWGYYWILHPTQGYMVLTRCCMGWAGSMGLRL